MANQGVSIETIINEFKLNVVYLPENISEMRITRSDINRPALPLADFYDKFEPDRIQIVGITECAYLDSLNKTDREDRLRKLFSQHPPMVIYTHGNPVDETALQIAEECNVPLLSTEERTSAFTAAIIASLNVKLAPMETRHGVLVEVYGEGVFITGDSGVGKSEAAIELIKRGHRFIADDAVELRRVSAKTIVGSAPELIRHYIELRGIGIVDVCRLFGMGAVKETEKIDLVVHFEPWEEGKAYERLGMVENFVDIMGIKIPSLTIPVKPGRNLAVIMEIAAMNNRQKRMGYNTAQELNDKLMKQIESNEKNV